MNIFSLPHVREADKSSLFDGVHIVLFHARRVPPHLLVNVDGLTYSISVKGQFADEPLERILSYAERRNVELLFVEWKTDRPSMKAEIKNMMRRNVARYDRVTKDISCLSPIRDTVCDAHGAKYRNADFVFELLPMMAEEGLIGNAYCLNMPDVTGRSFVPVTYSRSELEKAIRSAAEKAVNG